MLLIDEAPFFSKAAQSRMSERCRFAPSKSMRFLSNVVGVEVDECADDVDVFCNIVVPAYLGQGRFHLPVDVDTDPRDLF